MLPHAHARSFLLLMMTMTLGSVLTVKHRLHTFIRMATVSVLTPHDTPAPAAVVETERDAVATVAAAQKESEGAPPCGTRDKEAEGAPPCGTCDKEAAKETAESAEPSLEVGPVVPQHEENEEIAKGQAGNDSAAAKEAMTKDAKEPTHEEEQAEKDPKETPSLGPVKDEKKTENDADENGAAADENGADEKGAGAAGENAPPSKRARTE